MYKINLNGDILWADGGETLSDVLMRNGKTLEHPCGGKGICGKCRVSVNGKEELSCRYKVESDICVSFDSAGDIVSQSGVTENGIASESSCFVLDIGTTTLALSLVSLDSKKAVKTVTAVNPQRIYGADVISRIAYCSKNSPQILRDVLIEKVNEMISSFDQCKADKLYICGNTTMLHLFFGEDCSPMGVAPYIPSFLEMRTVSAASVGINGVKEIISLPCVAAFFGADIVAGMNFVGIPQGGKYSLLVDLGTNAEIVLMGENGSVSTSAAAGPCFEGVGISCGMSAASGAVYAFSDGKVTTVNDEKPVGICGTGLIDIMAYMLDKGIVDSTGFMNDECFEAADGVFVTQEDVRNYQLAKSAVYSAILSLVKYNDITLDDIKTVYLSGGFSACININNAVKTGILPKELSDKCVAINNSALKGTIKYACEQNDLSSLVQKTKYIDLSTDVFFSDMFIENMMF